MDRKLSDMTRSEAVEEKTKNDTSIRYAIMMSKMSTHCADLCSDELTSKLFIEGLEKLVKAIKKKRNSMTENVNATVRTSGVDDGTADNNASPVVVYNDHPQSDAASVPFGKKVQVNSREHSNAIKKEKTA
jgi:hypothetical protein